MLDPYRLLPDYYALDDPLDRWRHAKQAQADAEMLVGLTTDMAARALAELHVDGWSLAQIADATGVTRSRVQQLVARGADVALPAPDPTSWRAT